MGRAVYKYALLLAIFFVIQITSGRIVRAKRDDTSGSNNTSNSSSSSGSSGNSSSSDDGMMQTVKDMVNYLPLVGGMAVTGIEDLEYGWMRAEQLTDGAIGRVLGGTLPCTIYLDGISCSGVTTDSDVASLVESILDPIPGLMLPGFVKALIVFIVDVSWSPAIDVLFGGVQKS